MGLRAGLDGCGKSRPHRNSIPGLKVQCKSNFAHVRNEYMVRLWGGGCSNFPKTRAHQKVFGAIAVTRNEFYAEGPQVLVATAKNSFARAAWRPGFVHPYTTISVYIL